MVEVRDFYAALVESSDDAIVAKDVNGVVVAWNPAAEHLFGWTEAEMVGHSIRRLLPQDRHDEEDLILERVRAGERVGQFFTKRLHKDGSLLDVSITVSPVRDRTGKIVGASKIARNAGPLLADQRRLRESEALFRTLADTISQFVWVADGDGRAIWFNQRYYDFTGLTERDGLDRRRQLVHPDYIDPVYIRLRQAIETGEDWEDVFPMRGKEGKYRWFLFRVKSMRNDSGQIVRWFGTATDIHDQREQAEQIRLLLMEVNHRSKNLLSTVQALARRTAGADREFIRRFEDRIRSLAINQDILVRREWREVPVEELVQHQLAFLSGAPGELTINGPECAIAPRGAEVIGMALHELATNSLKYGALSADGGQVEVGWRRPNGRFEMWWRERGGPPASEPGRTGFGTTLIRDVPRHNLLADVELSFEPGGLSWSLGCDVDSLSVSSQVD